MSDEDLKDINDEEMGGENVEQVLNEIRASTRSAQKADDEDNAPTGPRRGSKAGDKPPKNPTIIASTTGTKK
ncbi:hypothetical protein M408DRAFT_23405 [Serendipita vermifera MAFF 305830]|uniref:Uncharacterized protein n=1 Tax=Serendipita vermifera MAFF 305830 TaxID=933852 RepID=A0A0C2WRF0_SERVB|nr:hypothetical protein M408DRAFT_23405 [Serendipita vermifera MAFF 305830]